MASRRSSPLARRSVARAHGALRGLAPLRGLPLQLGLAGQRAGNPGLSGRGLQRQAGARVLAQRQRQRLGQLHGPGAGPVAVACLGLEFAQLQVPGAGALVPALGAGVQLQLQGAAAHAAIQAGLQLGQRARELGAQVVQLQVDGALAGAGRLGQRELWGGQFSLQREGAWGACFGRRGDQAGAVQLALQAFPAAAPARVQAGLALQARAGQ